jgi:hypothetical protein
VIVFALRQRFYRATPNPDNLLSLLVAFLFLPDPKMNAAWYAGNRDCRVSFFNLAAQTRSRSILVPATLASTVQHTHLGGASPPLGQNERFGQV